MNRQSLTEKYDQMMKYEKYYWQQGYKSIAGIDEAGRGPLAGPVVAAVCILDPEKPVYGLDDSKKLSEKKRNMLFAEIIDKALAWDVEMSDMEVIDRINILQATKSAMTRALEKLKIKPDFILIDAVKLSECSIPGKSIIKGDSLSVSIAAASIIAKVSRDRLMEAYDRHYPQYGFAKHKGYGTKSHYEALHQYGLCPLHRKTFLRNLTEKFPDLKTGER
jgi:ribonuclease HII